MMKEFDFYRIHAIFSQKRRVLGTCLDSPVRGRGFKCRVDCPAAAINARAFPGPGNSHIQAIQAIFRLFFIGRKRPCVIS
jgi:hypothetical protein